MGLLTRLGVLVEEQGQAYLADTDADSDEARALRPLQAAGWPCRPRLASGQWPVARPLARHKQSTGLFVSGLGLPHRLRPTRRAEGVDGAGPRLHLIRFGARITSLRAVSGPPLREHGVLAPNAKLRALVVPQEVPQEVRQEPEAPAQVAPPAECEAHCAHHRPVRLSWARLLKRVFEIDLAHCPSCGGELKDHRCHLGTAGDREDPHAPGVAGPCTAACACPWVAAARGLTIPTHLRSGGPAPRAAGIACVCASQDRGNGARSRGYTRNPAR